MQKKPKHDSINKLKMFFFVRYQFNYYFQYFQYAHSNYLVKKCAIEWIYFGVYHTLRRFGDMKSILSTNLPTKILKFQLRKSNVVQWKFMSLSIWICIQISKSLTLWFDCIIFFYQIKVTSNRYQILKNRQFKFVHNENIFRFFMEFLYKKSTHFKSKRPKNQRKITSFSIFLKLWRCMGDFTNVSRLN